LWQGKYFGNAPLETLEEEGEQSGSIERLHAHRDKRLFQLPVSDPANA